MLASFALAACGRSLVGDQLGPGAAGSADAAAGRKDGSSGGGRDSGPDKRDGGIIGRDGGDRFDTGVPDSGELPPRALCPGMEDRRSAAVAYHINVEHTGAQPDDELRLPFSRRWVHHFMGDVSYPLVACGNVYVIASNARRGSADLFALDATTGGTVWGPVRVAGMGLGVNAAFDGGRVFTVDSDGRMSAFDAMSGEMEWQVGLPGQSFFTTPPTAHLGRVFVAGAGVGGTVYAVDQRDGRILWTADVQNGDRSAPVVTRTGVFVSYACNQTYAFDPGNGTLLWHHSGPCEGGGGATMMLHQDRLYTRDGTGDLVLAAATGRDVTGYESTRIPSAVGDVAYFSSFAGFQSFRLPDLGPLTAFMTDEPLVTGPIVVGSHVVTGSARGILYLLDATTLEVVGTDQLQEGITPNDETGPTNRPVADLAAAEGMLFVPAGGALYAY